MYGKDIIDESHGAIQDSMKKLLNIGITSGGDRVSNLTDPREQTNQKENNGGKYV